MTTRIQLRRDTAANWTSNNPTLAEGELGFELDTNKFKIGNGIDDWNTLNYASSSIVNSLPSIDPTTLSVKTKDTIADDGPTCVAYGNGIYVVGSWLGYIYYSLDGENWVEASNSFRDLYNDVYDIVFANNLFVAVGEAGTIATSPDGITWTQRAVYDDISNTITTNYYDLTTIAYGDGKFVAVGWGSYGIIMTSTDGISWTQTTRTGSSHSNSVYYSGVVFGDGYFVISGWDNDDPTNYPNGTSAIVYAASSDLTSWTLIRIVDVDLYTINYGNGQFIAAGRVLDQQSTDLPIFYASSLNLNTWTQATSANIAFSYYASINFDYFGKRSLTYYNNIWFAGCKIDGNWADFNINTPFPLIYSTDNGLTWERAPIILTNGSDSDTITQISAFTDKVFISTWYYPFTQTQYAYLNDLTTWYLLQDENFYTVTVTYGSGVYLNKIINNRLFLGTYDYYNNDSLFYLTDLANIVLGYDPNSSTGIGWIEIPRGASSASSGSVQFSNLFKWGND